MRFLYTVLNAQAAPTYSEHRLYRVTYRSGKIYVAAKKPFRKLLAIASNCAAPHTYIHTYIQTYILRALLAIGLYVKIDRGMEGL